MTYISRQQTDDLTSSVKELSFNPSLLAAAREICSSYFKAHSVNRRRRRPTGVVIHQETYRGQLIFREPILLPYECFVPFEQIESMESS